jgi:putative peptidoglycan lipid II flippase
LTILRRGALVRLDSGPPAHAGASSVGANSVSVATWTLVSRVTGFLKVAVIAAVLGPTYFGNLFQAMNLLPNLTYEFLTGSLFITLLVPPLVRRANLAERARAEQIAGGFLGLAISALALVTVALVLAGPLVLGVFTAGVPDPAAAEAQRRVGWLLLALLMPQVVLYAVAGTGGAVQNAHGRFALAAGAPVLENVGVVVTLMSFAWLFGTRPDLETVALWPVLFLGLGTTAAVGLHAGAQWWGAHRVGVRLVPRRTGWRDPEVRDIVHRAVPSLGYSFLNTLRSLAALVVANRAPGGVVAFGLALNFFYLPVAVGGRPVSVAMLPELSRLHQQGAHQRFRQELVRGSGLVAAMIVPAAVGCAVLAEPIARAASFGEMATEPAILLVAFSLLALAPGILGEGAFLVSTQASYARDDASAPFRWMVVRSGVSLAGMAVAAFLFEGTAMLVVVGLAISVGNLVSAAGLGRRVSRAIPTPPVSGLRGPLGRAAFASLLMAGPAYATALMVGRALGGPLGDVVGVAAAASVGLGVYVTAQAACRSPELASLHAAFRERRVEPR